MRIQIGRGCFGTFLLILFLTWPSTASATGIALSHATLDWTGFTYSLTGGTRIADFTPGSDVFDDACSVVIEDRARSSTFLDFCKNRELSPGDWPNTSNSLTDLTVWDYFNGIATTADGFSVASSEVGSLTSTSGPHGGFTSGTSQAITVGIRGIIDGTPGGTLTISVPYTILCSVTAGDEKTIMSSAAAELDFAIGVDTVFQSASLNCDPTKGNSIQTGILTVSGVLGPDTLGKPIIALDVASAWASIIGVPEPPAAVILLVGLAALCALCRQQRSITHDALAVACPACDLSYSEKTLPDSVDPTKR